MVKLWCNNNIFKPAHMNICIGVIKYRLKTYDNNISVDHRLFKTKDKNGG